MKKLHVEIEYIEELLGTASANKEIHSEFIASKAPDAQSREDEIAARSNGISVFRYKMIGFVIASFIAGIAGGLYAPFLGFIQPKQFDFNASINDLIYVVFGGMGSVTGSVIAAFSLTILQEALRILKDYRLLIYPVLLILMMLFRPQGLLGTKEISFTSLYEKAPAFCRRLCRQLRSRSKKEA